MHFSEKASEEGFTNIANSFKMIGEIEKSHGDRFGRIVYKIRVGTLSELNRQLIR